jgi:hypothetical protein
LLAELGVLLVGVLLTLDDGVPGTDVGKSVGLSGVVAPVLEVLGELGELALELLPWELVGDSLIPFQTNKALAAITGAKKANIAKR